MILYYIMIQGKVSNNTAVLLRSLALIIILYQFRLIAGDMADTPVFLASLFIAFSAAVFFSVFGYKINTGLKSSNKNLNPIAVLIAIGLIPLLTRTFIALPRLFISGDSGRNAIALDSLLLNLDRNNFVSLLPFYWAAVTSWFSLRSRKFLRIAVIADAAMLLVIYSIVRTMDVDLYRWPVVMISVFAGIVFLQALTLLFSLPPEFRLRTKEKIPAVIMLFVLIFIGAFLFLKPSQERALEKGGGLLEPKLFSFDFSQFLRLDSEISMNDDLILIVKKESDDYDNHVLLRRSVLSGYSRKQGFFRIEELDERSHPQRLPARITELNSNKTAINNKRLIRQEYFLVNFDAAAFIGINDPVLITPYESWDDSSFRSAYKVESITSTANPRELSRLSRTWPDAAELGLSESEFKIYTEYGGDERIKAYAQELTEGLDRYSDKIRMIHDRLKFGEYRYSLKPGIAPDGDQLGWFLFESKKGYCSYYAFAMTLLLRSLGIPARLAAGFFIDPLTNTFDYYPVRSDMAHAWVEVPFPGQGWIEFDPTTENLAEGEEFRFSAGVDPKLFERLMREILENRNLLRAKDGGDAALPSPVSSLARSAAALLYKFWYVPVLLVVVLLWIYIRLNYLLKYYFCRDRRKKAVWLWKHCQRRLRLAGFPRIAGETAEAEWALSADRFVRGIYVLYQSAAAARFAPDYTPEDFSAMQKNYREFNGACKLAVSPWLRLLAWVFPPLALIPSSGRDLHKGKELSGSKDLPKSKELPDSKELPRSVIRCALPLIFLLFFTVTGTRAQNNGQIQFDEDALYNSARDAEYAEHWERAIDLYRTGQKRYPGDPRFPWSLGNLYYERSLYGLAWDEFRKAEAMNPFDINVLFRLARTAGYLNLSLESADYFQRVLAIDPDSKDAIGSLGWMYYKIHRLGEGQRLLSEAIDRLGDDADLAMTLGTIYSDMYNYNEGKYWYQKAISEGQALGDRVFTAVAHYNLSILESRFYQFDLSMDETNASLDSQTRASGLLSRGELNLRRLDLKQAQSDFQAAYEIDTSPLAKLSLAQVYQISGRLDEARLYAEDCLKANEFSWMLNYGIDPDRYKRDIHEILRKTYKGLYETESFLPWGRIEEKIFSLFRRITYGFKSEVHRMLYQKYSLAAADAYFELFESEDQTQDVFIQYYNAFESYPRRALSYLNRARELEIGIIPAAIPSYDLEEGILLKDRYLIEQALTGLDPRWERDMLLQCYREFARFGAGGSALSKYRQLMAKRSAAEELFMLNRGALRQAGIGLPVHIKMDFAENIPRFSRGEKTMFNALKKAGFIPLQSPLAANAVSGTAGYGPEARYRLEIGINGSAVQEYTVFCDLIDTQGTGQTLRYTFPLRNFSRAAIYDFARSLGNAAFTL